MNYIKEDHKIYVLDQDKREIVRATFPFIKEGVVVVDHTYVDPSLRGQGIASELMHEVSRYAKEKGYKVVATCPYAVVWYKKHQEYNSLIDLETQSELAPECRI
jgi:hypothetical protein